jgi:hypothetical protein
MKLVSVIKIFASLLGLVVFGVLPARAQSEIDPDHFDSPSCKPLENGKTNVIREAGPIQYNATLNQKGQAIGIAGAVHQLGRNHPGNAVIVEISGETRRLSAIQVAKLDWPSIPSCAPGTVENSDENETTPDGPSRQYYNPSYK